MSRICLLCDRKSTKKEYLALHGFPKNQNLSRKWKEVCGLTDRDDISHVYICSHHFAPKNVKLTNVGGKPRTLLQPGSIPSISVPNPSKVRFQSQYDNIDDDDESTTNILEQTKFPISPKSRPQSSTITSTTIPTSSQFKIVSISDNQDTTKNVNLKEMNSTNLFTHRTFIVGENTDHDYLKIPSKPQLDVETDQDTDNAENVKNEWADVFESNLSRKRRFYEPRFISEMLLWDFSTPAKARKMLKLLKEKDEEKTKKIKRLQDINRRLKKHLAFLEDKVNNSDSESKRNNDPFKDNRRKGIRIHVAAAKRFLSNQRRFCEEHKLSHDSVSLYRRARKSKRADGERNSKLNAHPTIFKKCLWIPISSGDDLLSKKNEVNREREEEVKEDTQDENTSMKDESETQELEDFVSTQQSEIESTDFLSEISGEEFMGMETENDIKEQDILCDDTDEISPKNDLSCADEVENIEKLQENQKLSQESENELLLERDKSPTSKKASSTKYKLIVYCDKYVI